MLIYKELIDRTAKFGGWDYSRDCISPASKCSFLPARWLGKDAFPPTAGQWADPSYYIPSWEIPVESTAAEQSIILDFSL